MQDVIATIYREESRRVLATLIRVLGDFDLAEEAMQDAFAAASAQWPREGVPDRPRAWLVAIGRRKGIDQLRRQERHDASLAVLAQERSAAEELAPSEEEEIEDDSLRLIFTCCHPSLGTEAQLALTLREVCGLTTEEVASAFLTRPATVAQRIVRAKAKIRDARIPYEVPTRAELPSRLEAVLQVVYLVFNEGYSASSGAAVLRTDLAQEAIRLGRLLCELLPEPEVRGLLALMLLQDSRRQARVTAQGGVVLLEEQDRTLWNQDQIREGRALVVGSLVTGGAGAYALQAAIAAVHAEAPDHASTDWPQIVGLYDLLLRLQPTAIVRLNRAVAVAMRDGPAAGLELIDALLAEGHLLEYHLAHAARGDLCRRLGRHEEARIAYARALDLARQAPERSFRSRRLAELASTAE